MSDAQQVKPTPNVFHEHLDVCQRCREQPFNLCLIGQLKLAEAAAALGEPKK